MRKTILVLFIFSAIAIVATSPLLSLIPAQGTILQGDDVLAAITSKNSPAVSTQNLSPTALTNIPVPRTESPPPPNGVTTIFEWWNTNWHYRIRLDIDALSFSRYNITIPTYINMTTWLEDAGISETVDEKSTRVIEQDPISGDVIVEQPSVFFKDANWDADTSATGWLLFFLNGSLPANTNRTVFVYFDTLAKGTKPLSDYPEVVNGWFSQYYGFSPGQHFNMPDPNMYDWKNLDTTTNLISYHDGSGNNFPSGADGPSPDWSRFSANYTAWLPVLQGGSYGFQTSSDDGSWFYVNGTLVVNNGGGHGTRTRSASKALTPGLYPLWVPWYENTGGATIYVRWQPPGAGSYSYLTGTNVTAIKWGIQMDPANPCNLTWGSAIGIFLLQVHVENADNNNMVNTPVHLVNASDSSEIFATVNTDNNGNASFNVISPGNYSIMANFTTAYPTAVSEKLNITDSWTFNLNASVEGQLLTRVLTIGVTDITYSVYDLDNRLMAQTPTETTKVYIYNDSYVSYLAFATTDASGQVTFSGFPIGQYNVSWDYTNTVYPNDYGETEVPNNETSILNTFTHKMILPLIDVSLYVESYDGLPVPEVQCTLDNVNYSQTQTHDYGPITDPNGDFTFERILNGTWLIFCNRDDDYGQVTVNSTQLSAATTSYTPGSPFQINFPLDNLRIHVQETTSGEKLAGANVTVWKNSGATLVTSATTDGNGDVVFTWLRNASYWVNASILGQNAVQSDQIGVDLHNIAPDYTTVVTIRVTVSFGKLDCAFLLQNASIIYTYYNSNFTLRFRFVNVTGGLPDVAIDDTIAEWINFTLTHSGLSQPIVGTWNQSGHFQVWHDVDGYWYIWVNTTAWGMGVSTEPYIVAIDGYAVNGTTPFNDPETLTINIFVQTTPTTLTNPGTQTVTWGDLISFTVTYTDTNHTLPLAGATVEYLITGAYSRMGSLSDSGNGIYSFSHLPTVGDLNLPSGSYTVNITATFTNYETQLIFLTLNINSIPTDGSVTPTIVALNWSNSFFLSVNYSVSADGSPITGATVYVLWTGIPVGLSYNGGTGLYEVQLFASDWAIGTHNNVEVVAQLSNHTTQDLHFDVTIVETPTTATNPGDFIGQNWGSSELSILTFTDVNMSTDIAGAVVSLNLSTGYWSVVDNGDGTYDLAISMTFAPGTYLVELRYALNGYSQQLITFTIELLVPLQIESTTPEGYTIYWTQNFNIEVMVINGFTTQNETGVTVTWSWMSNFGGFSLAGNIYTSLNSILGTMFGTPGSYTVNITATMAGASTARGVIYVLIEANPTQVTPTDPGEQTITWGENGTILFDWTDDISGATGIAGATITATIVGIGDATIFDHGNGTYTVMIPTELLSMDAPGSYTLTITFSKTGYLDASPSPISILCSTRQTTITVVVDPSEIIVGTGSVQVWADYTDLLTSDAITSASLTWTLTNQLGATIDSGTMIYDAAESRYYSELNTAGLPMDAYQIRVAAQLANYESDTDTVVLQVIEPGFYIPGTGIYVTTSQLLFAVAGIAIVILAFASYVGYKRATIPYQLKVLNKAIKAINKNKPADTHPALKDRETKMKESLRRLYRKAGIQIDEEDAAG